MSIESIINDALFHIEHLQCPTCKDKVDFYLKNKTPFCIACDSSLAVTYEDLKLLRKLTKRSGIKRLKSKIG